MKHRCGASALLIVAGLMGGAGVAMQAAAAHVGGGDLARTDGTILLTHAVAVLAVSSAGLTGKSLPRGLAVSTWSLAIGTVLFASDLALAAFYEARPFPMAAPIGGLGMLAGWLGFVVTGIVCLVRGRRDDF